MSHTSVKQKCPLSPTLFSMYIDELETYLDDIDGNSPHLFNMMVASLSYGDNAILLSKSRACLQRLNKLHEFGTSSSLEVNFS